MGVKAELLKELENNRGSFISGAELAARINVSRNAVWKAVKALTDDGYEILSVKSRGYCLTPSNDILSPQSVEKYLGAESDFKDFKIEVKSRVTSTNTVLKEYAASGAPHGTVLIAEEQSGGRGRRGNKRFSSPRGTGLYMSILLRPNISTDDAMLLTSAAAVAVAESVEELTGRETQIKWVNDVLCGGKKICGILTEASFDLESGALDYAVVGIGVNITEPEGGFSDEIKDVAGAIFEKNPPSDARSALAAAILTNFKKYYETLGERAFLEGYKSRSCVVGKDITIIQGDRVRQAVALGIDDECRLRVRCGDEEELLSSGEISIRVEK